MAINLEDQGQGQLALCSLYLHVCRYCLQTCIQCFWYLTMFLGFDNGDLTFDLEGQGQGQYQVMSYMLQKLQIVFHIYL